MDIRHLKYFLAIAKAQSFVGAARALNMTQPPLSKRIADLEAEIGVPLFERGSRRVTLTGHGAEFLPVAQEAVRSFDAAVQFSSSLARRSKQRIRIALPPETSRHTVANIKSEMEMAGIDGEIYEATTAVQMTQLAARSIDVGVVRLPIDTAGLDVGRRLWQPLGIYMTTRHPLADQAEIDLADLTPYPLVMFPREMAPGLYDSLIACCEAHGYKPPEILHSIIMTKSFLRYQSAVMFLVERKWRTMQSSEPGEFVWKPVRGSSLDWQTVVVQRSDARTHQLGKVAALVESILISAENWQPFEDI